MDNIFTKIQANSGIITVILAVAVFAYIYQLDFTKKSKIVSMPKGKTVEEIMAMPVDKTTPPDWDKEFKSAIEPN